MSYFKKRKIGKQIYVYRIERRGKKCKIETYIGNINCLPEDAREEVENYFKIKECSKNIYNVRDAILIADKDKETICKFYGAIWLIYQIEKEVGAITIINSMTFKITRTKTYDTGFYFFVAAVNRLLYPLSKNQLPEWITLINFNEVLGIDIDPEKFNSTNYWHHCNSITQEKVEDIINTIIRKVFHIIIDENTDFILPFDVTNFFTFICFENESELAQKGYNKQGRHRFRQIALSCLIDKDLKISVHYKIFKGNMNDSKIFNSVLLELIEQCHGCGKEVLTLVFDKGVVTEENIKNIDEHENVHFITSYSIKKLPKEFSSYLKIDISKYKVIDCRHNNLIDEKLKDKEDDSQNLNKSKIKAIWWEEEFWGKKRRFILTFSEALYEKHKHKFDENMSKLSDWLDEAKNKIKNNCRGYKTKKDILDKYRRAAEANDLSEDVFELTFKDNSLDFTYRRKMSFIDDYTKYFGKNLIVSDRFDLAIGKIVQIYIDKNEVEITFRHTKDDKCGSVWPIYHWTDNQMSCHIGMCILSLLYLQLIEYVLRKNNITKSAKYLIQKMHNVVTVKTIFNHVWKDPVEINDRDHEDEYCKMLFEIFSDKSLASIFNHKSE